MGGVTMKYETAERIYKTMQKVEEYNFYILIAIPFFVIYPFWALYEGYKYLVHKSRGDVRDPDSGEWTTKEKIEQNKLKVKMKNREIPLAVRNHIHPRKDDCFYFFEKRNLKIPTDKLVYVESEYNDTMHRFFNENTEWIDRWQRWYGFDIVDADYEDIKEGMFFPEDFAVFKHGFLWHSPISSRDREADIFGNIHYYEIDPDSDISIKEQMDLFMRKIYDTIDTI